MPKVEIIFEKTTLSGSGFPEPAVPTCVCNQDCGGTNHEPYSVSQLSYHFERRAPVVAVCRLRQITASSPMGLGNGEATIYTRSAEKSSHEVTRNAVRSHAAKAVCRVRYHAANVCGALGRCGKLKALTLRIWVPLQQKFWKVVFVFAWGGTFTLTYPPLRAGVGTGAPDPVCEIDWLQPCPIKARYPQPERQRGRPGLEQAAPRKG
jgi:hypothetical protein